MGWEGRLYSSKSTNGGKGLKNSKIKSYLNRIMTKRPNICFIFEKLNVQGCQIWHSHVSMSFNSAAAHSTRPHNAKKALYVIISAEIPENLVHKSYCITVIYDDAVNLFSSPCQVVPRACLLFEPWFLSFNLFHQNVCVVKQELRNIDKLFITSRPSCGGGS